jgi:hypothetical protein
MRVLKCIVFLIVSVRQVGFNFILILGICFKTATFSHPTN